MLLLLVLCLCTENTPEEAANKDLPFIAELMKVKQEEVSHGKVIPCVFVRLDHLANGNLLDLDRYSQLHFPIIVDGKCRGITVVAKRLDTGIWQRTSIYPNNNSYEGIKPNCFVIDIPGLEAKFVAYKEKCKVIIRPLWDLDDFRMKENKEYDLDEFLPLFRKIAKKQFENN